MPNISDRAGFAVLICPPETVPNDAAKAVITEVMSAFESVVLWAGPGTAMSEEKKSDRFPLRPEHRELNQLLSVLDAVDKYGAETHFVLLVHRDPNFDSEAMLRPVHQALRTLHDSLMQGRPDKARCTVIVETDSLFELLFKEFRPPRVSIQVPTAKGAANATDLDRALQEAWRLDGRFATDEAIVDAIDQMTVADASRLHRNGLWRAARDRIRKVRETLHSRFKCREKAIDMLIACALARVNVVLLGPPGTAKSLLVRSFAEAVGVRRDSEPIRKERDVLRQIQYGKAESRGERRLFEYLLTRYTAPEEIFGGTDIDVLLKSGVHFRRSTGMLPCADVAFLDEIFKANSAILNALLSITNERLFYNMGRAFRVNLAFTVGASNETPDREELGALFDRFPIRVPCRLVPEEHALEVLASAHAFDVASFFNDKTKRIAPVACLNDIRLLSKVMDGAMYGGADKVFANAANSPFMEGFHELMLIARREFDVSDRTIALIARLCRAVALVEGAEELSVEHLRPWGYVSTTMDGLASFQRTVQGVVNNRGGKNPRLFDES